MLYNFTESDKIHDGGRKKMDSPISQLVDTIETAFQRLF